MKSSTHTPTDPGKCPHCGLCFFWEFTRPNLLIDHEEWIMLHESPWCALADKMAAKKVQA